MKAHTLVCMQLQAYELSILHLAKEIICTQVNTPTVLGESPGGITHKHNRCR
jgi:hypothetical protein